MTLQRRDVLMYQEKQYALDRDILKSYFEAHPDRKPVKPGFDSTLHRGYFSEFQIKDKQLFVVDLRVNVDFNQESGEMISASVMESSLPDLTVCTWFSGDLNVFSIDENPVYLKFTIQKGKVIDVETLTEDEYDRLGNHAYDYF